MSDWAALVYGRTLNVDFRFIAVPDKFTSEDLAWIEPYVFTTTRLAETLANHPRWSLIRDDRWCIVGATCTAHDLVNAGTDTRMKTMINDRAGRPLYLFAAYVLKAEDVRSVKSLGYENLRLGLVAPLYKYVGEQWLANDYDDVASRPVRISSVEEPLTAMTPEDPGPNQTRHVPWTAAINTDQQTIRLFPDDEATRTYLWNSAISQRGPVSMCLGLTRRVDAEQGCFLNATISGIQEPVTLQFAAKQEFTVPQESLMRSARGSQPTRRPPNHALREPKTDSRVVALDMTTIGWLIASASVGAVIGGTFLAFRNGALVGAAVGGVLGVAVKGMIDANALSGEEQEELSHPSDISISDQDTLRVGLKKKPPSTENHTPSSSDDAKGDHQPDSVWKL